MSIKKLGIVNVVLTNIAIGYKNLSYIAEKMFPVVYVDKRGVTIPKFGKHAFRQYDTSRAPGAKSNQYNPDDLEQLPFVLTEKDIETPIDDAETRESLFNLQEAAAEDTSDILDLSNEIEVAALVTNPANYAEANKLALTTGLNDPLSDPVALAKAARNAVRSQIGRYPKHAFCSALTMSILESHPKLIELYKYSTSGVLTTEQVAKALGVKELHVGEAIKAGADNVTEDVWPDFLLFAYIPEKIISTKNPAFGYTLRQTGYKVTDEYYDPSRKSQLVRTTDVRKAAFVGADAGYLITNCYVEPEPEGE